FKNVLEYYRMFFNFLEITIIPDFSMMCLSAIEISRWFRIYSTMLMKKNVFFLLSSGTHLLNNHNHLANCKLGVSFYSHFLLSPILAHSFIKRSPLIQIVCSVLKYY